MFGRGVLIEQLVPSNLELELPVRLRGPESIACIAFTNRMFSRQLDFNLIQLSYKSMELVQSLKSMKH